MRTTILTFINKPIFASIMSVMILSVFSKSWAAEEEGKRVTPVINWLLSEQENQKPPPPSGAFIESDGLIVVEMESLNAPQDWELKSDDTGAIGSYIEWADRNRLQTPGFGLISVNVVISNPGTYQFLWRNSIRDGESTTDSNDSFLRILADNFYGFRQRGLSIVCPREQADSNRCEGREPEGSSSDGWFKVYRSGGNPPNDWVWRSFTSDSDAHSIYADFDQAGVYEIQISARSRFHAIDRFVLFRSLNQADNVDENFATNSDRTESSIIP